MSQKIFRSIVNLVEKHAVLTPDKTAVAGGRISLSYQELNEYANRLANALLYFGVQREERVMILLPRNIMYYAVNLGILKAGAAFITADVSYPDERIRFIAQDAGCRYVIVTRNIFKGRKELMKNIQAEPLFLDELLASPWPDEPFLRISEHDLAYCIYTSGSTGRPKGVMIEHGNLMNFLVEDPENVEVMRIVECSHAILACAALTFDVSLMEEFIAFAYGKTLVMASSEQITNPLLLKELLDRYQVDCLICTPSYLNMLLSVGAMRPSLARIRAFDLGAEAFPGELYTKIREVNPEGVILNGYGPTETTISCICKEITGSQYITIGRPAAGVSCYIVDEDLNEVPAGEPGELLICGKGVGRGYINLPEKTEQVFVSFRGMRGYRSGDLARIDDNGEIVFHGRIDSQIKLKGLRIELGEVENVMAGCSLIDSCAAGPVDNRYLCLYYVLKEPSEPEDARKEIRAYAASHLAHYMVPDLYMQLPEMPVTTNWKIDRKRLPRPVIQAVEGAAPSTKMQEEICAVIRDVLGRPCPGTDVDLLEEGMSSLDLISFISSLGEKYGVPLSMADIVALPTVAGIEQFILEKQLEVRTENAGRARALLAQGVYYRLWQAANSTESILPVMLRLDKSVDSRRLADAIRRAAAWHPGIFLRLEEDEGGLIVRIPDTKEIRREADEIPVDIRQVTEEEMEPIAGAFGCGLLSPDQDRWYEFRICETPESTYLLMKFAHVLGDGDSVTLLADDILKAYSEEPLRQEGMHIVDFAAEQQEKSESDYYRKLFTGMEHWPSLPAPSAPERDPENLKDLENPEDLEDRENLENLPGLEDPESEEDYITREFTVSGKEIGEILHGLGVSMNIFFAGLTVLALCRESGAKRFPLLIAYNGREDYRLKNTFGFLVKPLLVCPEICDGMTVRDFMQSLNRQVFESMRHPVSLEEMYQNYPGWTDHLYIYQAEEKSPHMLNGREVEEIWLSDPSEEEAPDTVKNEEETIDTAEAEEITEPAENADDTETTDMAENTETADPAEMAGSAETDHPDIYMETALRWAEDQISFEIYADDDHLSCALSLPADRISPDLARTLISDMDHMCRTLRQNLDEGQAPETMALNELVSRAPEAMALDELVSRAPKRS